CKHAHVHVDGRDVRILRMEDERDAERLERRAGEIGAAVLRRRRRQRRAADVREADAAALEERAALDEARDAVAFELAAGLALPAVDAEGIAAFALERFDDRRLQREQVAA